MPRRRDTPSREQEYYKQAGRAAKVILSVRMDHLWLRNDRNNYVRRLIYNFMYNFTQCDSSQS